MQLGTRLTTTARGQARPGCSFKCDRPAQSRPMPSSMQLAEDLRPSVGWIQLCVRHTNTARGQARPGCSFGCDRLAPHHHGPRSGTTWMQLRVRPPPSALSHAKMDAAWWGPAGPSVGWMQLGTRLTFPARGQARPGCSFGCDRLARPGPVLSWMQRLPGPRWVGCSLPCSSPPRPDVRHELDAASGATALLGPAPCQVGCILLDAIALRLWVAAAFALHSCLSIRASSSVRLLVVPISAQWVRQQLKFE